VIGETAFGLVLLTIHPFLEKLLESAFLRHQLTIIIKKRVGPF
jgi:hypothetical protein